MVKFDDRHKNSIVVKLLSCIYNDKANPSILRINTYSMFVVLIDTGDFVLDREKFEERLANAMNRHLPKGLPVDIKGRYVVATAIYNLAKLMHIPKDKLVQSRIEIINDPDYTDLIDPLEIKEYKEERAKLRNKYFKERGIEFERGPGSGI